MQKKRLTIPATLAVLTLAGACSPAPTPPDTNDPCTEAYGPDCMQARSADGGPERTPDGGIECLC